MKFYNRAFAGIGLVIAVGLFAFAPRSFAEPQLIDFDPEIMQDDCWRLGELYGPLCYEAQTKGRRVMSVPATKENKGTIGYYSSLEFVALPVGDDGCLSLEDYAMQDYCAVLKGQNLNGYWRVRE